MEIDCWLSRDQILLQHLYRACTAILKGSHPVRGALTGLASVPVSGPWSLIRPWLGPGRGKRVLQIVTTRVSRPLPSVRVYLRPELYPPSSDASDGLAGGRDRKDQERQDGRVHAKIANKCSVFWEWKNPSRRHRHLTWLPLPSSFPRDCFLSVSIARIAHEAQH